MLASVALIKVAAIGDVAIAARALREFVLERDARVEVHWIIDRTLARLARALLEGLLDVRWHEIDAEALFRGSAVAKARVALDIAMALRSAKPEQIVLLHRDWRYRALARPFARRGLIAIGRGREMELQAYRRAFAELGERIHAPVAPLRSERTAEPSARTGRIGILVGGARSQKLDFAEKRWPRFTELAGLLLDKTGDRVVLLGGPGDVAEADRIIASLVARATADKRQALATRIENLVGKAPLEKIPAVLAGLDSFVSIDSGLAHIAASVMTAPHQRIVTLFGPTDPGVWAPSPSGRASARVLCKAPSCSPCYTDDGVFRPCRFEGEYFQHCMTAIHADEVLTALT